MISDGLKVGGGSVTSRAWGHGGVIWSPGGVKAQVHLPGYAVGPMQRHVLVGTSHVDHDGRLKHISIELEADATATGAELKQMLLVHDQFPLPGADVGLSRLKLTVYGTELDDDSPLRSLAPTAEMVQARLHIRRRTASLEEDVAACSTSTGDGAAGETKSELSAPSVNSSAPAGPLRSLVVRSTAGGGRAARVDGLDGGMDVRQLRALVAELPMTLSAWHGHDEAEEGAESKKAPLPKIPGDEEPVPVEHVLLLGVGVDLESNAAAAAISVTQSGTDGRSSKRGEGGKGSEAGSGGGGDGARGGVHLRDGRQLQEYALADGSLIYLVLEGKPS